VASGALVSATSTGAARASDDAEVRVDRNMCGYNSMMLVLAYLNVPSGALKMRALMPPEQAPFTFAQLEACARMCGCRTYLTRYSDRERAKFACPAILHVRATTNSSIPDHFVACFGETRDGLVAADFPGEPVIVPRFRLLEFWDGDVLFIDTEEGTAITQMQDVRRRWIGSLVATVLLAATCLYGLTRSKRNAATSNCSQRVHPSAGPA